VAKFAAGGKPSPKKDLGLMAMTYGNVYVASIAMGAKSEQSTRAFLEAESYPGVSLVIAYSHCIAHGINMSTAMNYQKEVVDSGRWLLYRYDPRLTEAAKNPLQLDMRSPKLTAEQTMYKENRFKMLSRSNPEEAKKLLKLAQGDINTRWAMYQYLASRHVETSNDHDSDTTPTQQPETV
jgi:pyruvate-ferredoxin/flavodoxin oxidoreductase